MLRRISAIRGVSGLGVRELNGATSTPCTFELQDRVGGNRFRRPLTMLAQELGGECRSAYDEKADCKRL